MRRYCEYCNAYLNDQTGFNEYSDSWFCSECGYRNYFSDDDYKSSGYNSFIDENNSSYSRTDYSSEILDDSYSSPIDDTYDYQDYYDQFSSYSQPKKGHSIILWTLFSLCCCCCCPILIPIIIYFSVSSKHYWHA